MAQLRIGLAQVNATVGDLDGNSDKVIEWTMRAAEQGARIVVFPEMMLTGYPVEDLALRKSFVDASIASLHGLARDLSTEGLDGVLAAGGCKLKTRGKKYQLSAPKVVRDPKRRRFPIPVRLVLRTVGADEYMELTTH